MTLVPPEAPVIPRYSWAEVWTAVLTRPSVQTFQEILSDPAASRRRAYTWMLAISIVIMLFIAMLSMPDANTFLASLPEEVDLSLAEAQSLITTSMICAIPFMVLIGLASFALLVSIAQFSARLLGADVKTDSSAKLVYSFASIQAPLNIISLLFMAIPNNAIVGVISLLATIYQFYLMSLALRTVYGFSLGRAVASICLSMTVFFVITVVLMMGMLSLM